MSGQHVSDQHVSDQHVSHLPRRNPMSKSASTSPLVIGVIIAAVAITQSNFIGAAFAVGFGAIASVVMLSRGTKSKGN